MYKTNTRTITINRVITEKMRMIDEIRSQEDFNKDIMEKIQVDKDELNGMRQAASFKRG
jgi:hypothetical protein